MTTKECTALKPGDRVVMFAGTTEEAAGTVTLHHTGSVRVFWDDGISSVIDHRDGEELSRGPAVHPPGAAPSIPWRGGRQ